MARKVISRKALREEVEAAERSAPEKEKKKAEAKKPAKPRATKRKSRAAEAKVVRVKLYWHVVNQAMKPVAKFEYHQKNAAQKKADELSQGGKTPHFLHKHREEIAET
ncbi:MAG: hypothetical protein GX575_07240 [Candidatus Anammoximicrobium sp.]|nr:hypothetical protein [Candidatus Anammoximicrobium sp.]